MANEKIKPEGIFVFPKNAKAPDFVLGTAVISIDKFNEWINNHQGYLSEYKGESQLKLQILKSKEGGVYFQVDTYQANSSNF
jgi:hypothetical protein